MAPSTEAPPAGPRGGSAPLSADRLTVRRYAASRHRAPARVRQAIAEGRLTEYRVPGSRWVYVDPEEADLLFVPQRVAPPEVLAPEVRERVRQRVAKVLARGAQR